MTSSKTALFAALLLLGQACVAEDARKQPLEPTSQAVTNDYKECHWITDNSSLNPNAPTAVPNDNLSDRDAIQWAAKVLHSLTDKRCIYFPPGTYKLTDSDLSDSGALVYLPSDIQLVSTPGQAVLDASSCCAQSERVAVFGITSAAERDIPAASGPAGRHHVSIDGFVFKGSSQVKAAVSVITGGVSSSIVASDITVQNCEASSFKNTFFLSGSPAERVRILHNYIHDIEHAGTSMEATGINPSWLRRSQISGNRIERIGSAAGDWAIYAGGGTSFTSADNIISENQIESTSGGIKVGNGDHRGYLIVNNTIRADSSRTKRPLIVLVNTRSVIVANNALRLASVQPGNGADIVGIDVQNSDGFLVQGNTIDGDKVGAAQQYAQVGIRIDGTGDLRVSGQIVANAIHDLTTPQGSDNSGGIIIFRASGVRVASNVIGPVKGRGIVASDSSETPGTGSKRIKGLDIHGNTIALADVGSDGVYVQDTDNTRNANITIKNNSVTGIGGGGTGYGVRVVSGKRVVVTNNSVFEHSGGTLLESCTSCTASANDGP